MGLFFIALLMPVIAQADQTGDADVYEITPTDGSESYFAIIENATSDQLLLQIYYKPGKLAGEKDTVSKSKVKYSYVGRDSANKEIARRQDKVSQVINGVRVPNEEIERAKMARESASAVEEQLSVPDPTSVDPAVNTDVPPVDPGPLAFRGPQIMLILGALVLIGIVVKLVILG